MTRATPAPTPARLGYEDLPRLLSMMTGDEKHGPSATSTLDVLWVLYDRILRVEPHALDDPARDRFLLSKGHGPMAYYAVLAAKGFIPVDWLRDWATFDSPLGQHPDRTLVPGVEIGSGSLGHGFAMAVGAAYALRVRGLEASRVVCLLGDAELDEGSNHEAIALAARLALGNLTAVVIDNRSASLGWPGGIASRFSNEGWSSATVDGRDHDAIERAFRAAGDACPHCVVATVEPKG